MYKVLFAAIFTIVLSKGGTIGQVDLQGEIGHSCQGKIGHSSQGYKHGNSTFNKVSDGRTC